MTNPAFEQAINQANYGASLIEAKDYGDAISNLSAALSFFKRLMALHTNFEEDNELSPKTSLDECMKTCSPSSDVSLDVDEEAPEGQFIYHQPIHIPAKSALSYTEGIMVSCMIIFNLAIAYHLQGLQEKDAKDITTSMVRALKLYELSFNLQREQQLDNNILFTLAIVSNLGVLHQQLQDQDSSTKCFEHVLSTLMYLTDCGEASKRYLDGFFVNVTKIVSEPCAAPAA